jgi:hypothetical protein
MSKRYQGNIICASPVEPSGPYETSTASGVWSFAEQNAFIKGDNWPKAGNVTPGQDEYTTPGSYSWTAPAGVTSVCVVCVGSGGSGAPYTGKGGGGGALAYKNNIAVTPGQSYTVYVGTYSGSPNSDSSFDGTTVKAGGGNGPVAGAVISGTGGNGGSANQNWSGGGGAGGYSGNGGDAGYDYSTQPTSGSGGGGSGGGSMFINNYPGGGGGGVGIYGEGSSGVCLNDGPWGTSFGSAGSTGGGGSGGNNAQLASATANDGPRGGAFGGGGGAGMYDQNSGFWYNPGTGQTGAVRIIWGANRAFPATNTGDA